MMLSQLLDIGLLRDRVGRGSLHIIQSAVQVLTVSSRQILSVRLKYPDPDDTLSFVKHQLSLQQTQRPYTFD